MQKNQLQEPVPKKKQSSILSEPKLHINNLHQEIDDFLNIKNNEKSISSYNGSQMDIIRNISIEQNEKAKHEEQQSALKRYYGGSPPPTTLKKQLMVPKERKISSKIMSFAVETQSPLDFQTHKTPTQQLMHFNSSNNNILVPEISIHSSDVKKLNIEKNDGIKRSNIDENRLMPSKLPPKKETKNTRRSSFSSLGSNQMGKKEQNAESILKSWMPHPLIQTNPFEETAEQKIDNKPKADLQILNATHELILFGQTNIRTTLNQPARRKSAFMMRNHQVPTPIQTKLQESTFQNNFQNQMSPTLINKDPLRMQEPLSAQLRKIGPGHLNQNIDCQSDFQKFQSDQISHHQMFGKPNIGIDSIDNVAALFHQEMQKEHLKLRRHNFGQNKSKINTEILNMDVEEMNRNTRFFKDYLNDQIQHKKRKSILQHMTQPLKEKGAMFSKQDSLTKGIQGESNGAPLRRLTVRGGENKKNENKQKNLINQKGKQSVKNILMNTLKNNKRRESKADGLSGVSGMSLTESYQFSSSDAESNIKNKIQRKRKHISQMQALGIPKGDEDDDVNEHNIRRINLGRVGGSSYVLYPDSSIRTLVDGISFFLLLFISIYIPFLFSFGVETANTSFDYFELAVDIWFILEILLNFFTGYNDDSVLIMDRQQISKRYLKKWFIIDIVSSAPLSFLQIATYDAEDSQSIQAFRSTKLLRILRFARYARLLKLMRFLKVNKQLQALEEFIVSDYINLLFKFSKICVGVLFITHWAACVLFTIGLSELENRGQSWLVLQKLTDSSVDVQYINSLYWAFTTMCTVGYGDFHPVTPNERIVSMMCMIVSSGVFAYIIEDIGRMISGFNLLADQYREKMVYVEKFLKTRELPLGLRVQIKRYLEYNWQLKKLYKIEEKQLLGLLNENLKGKITVYFNGRILQNIDVLCKFPIEFLSNLSFILKKQTYTINDNIIVEKETGNELFFLVNGRVSIIHRKSMTHITDLDKDTYFGEISFFTELTRQATVKARDFSDVLILSREDFLQMALKVTSEQALLLYHKIRESVTQNPKDFRQLQIKCYICYATGHIAIECKQFNRLKGNLVRYYKRLYRRSYESENNSDSEKNTKTEHFVSLASRKSDIRQLNLSNMTLDSQNNSPIRKRPNQRDLKMTSATRLQDSQLHREHSFSNLVLLPKDQQDGILHQSDNDFIKKEHRKKGNQSSSDSSSSSSSSSSSVGDLQEEEKEENIKMFQINDAGQGNQEGKDQQERENIFRELTRRNNKISQQLSLTPKNNFNTFESESQGTDQIIHFDTPPNDDSIPNSPAYLKPKSISLRKLTTLSKAKDSAKHSRNNDVIQEVLQEEDDEDDDIIINNKNNSHILRRHDNDQFRIDKRGDNEEEKRPFLTQSMSQQTPGPPKQLNELTRIVANRKRFSSKDTRTQQKENLKNNLQTKRKISIMPLQGIKQSVKTVVKKTFTTMVETFTQKQEIQSKQQQQQQNMNRQSYSKMASQKKEQNSSNVSLKDKNSGKSNQREKNFYFEFDDQQMDQEEVKETPQNVKNSSEIQISNDGEDDEAYQFADFMDTFRYNQRAQKIQDKQQLQQLKTNNFHEDDQPLKKKLSMTQNIPTQRNSLLSKQSDQGILISDEDDSKSFLQLSQRQKQQQKLGKTQNPYQKPKYQSKNSINNNIEPSYFDKFMNSQKKKKQKDNNQLFDQEQNQQIFVQESQNAKTTFIQASSKQKSNSKQRFNFEYEEEFKE